MVFSKFIIEEKIYIRLLFFFQNLGMEKNFVNKK